MLSWILVWFSCGLEVEGDVVLLRNGYRGVTVALSPRLSPADVGPDFLRSLTELLNSASQTVFKRLDGRAFFEEVTLLVPRSFDADGVFNVTDVKVSSVPNYKSAHVLIESDGDSLFGEEPYTLQYGQCGVPGLRTILPLQQVFKKDGTALGKEWFKLRYGVFSEEPIPNDPLYSEHSFSKQKVLCSSKSALDVVLNSDDFNNINLAGESTLSSVNVIVVKEAPLKLVVVWNVESANDATHGSFLATLDALKKTAQLETPPDAHMAVVFYGKDVFEGDERLLNMTNRNERFSFAKTVPSQPNEAGNIIKALEKAVKLLSSSQSEEGGFVLLITRESVNAADAKEAKTLLLKSKIALSAMVLSRPSEGDSVHNITATTGGKYILVPDEGKLSIPSSYLHLQYLQTNAISELTHSGTSYDETRFTISLKRLFIKRMSDSQEFTLPFTVDLQSAGVLRVGITKFNIKSFFRLTNTFTLSSPQSGTTFSAKDSEYLEHDTFHLREFRIEKPSAGDWKFFMKAPEVIDDPIYVDIKLEPGDTGEHPITLDVWLSSSSFGVDPRKPLIIYAELRKGSRTIKNAEVEAMVVTPDEEEHKFVLVDNGAGNPDVAAGDGIYSRYFTNFTKSGTYVLSVTAGSTDQSLVIGPMSSSGASPTVCCGSQFPSTGSQPSGSFSRYAYYGSFFSLEDKPEGDIYPPSRITDLRVTNVDVANTKITLQWTAPGNDFDSGAADEYEIRYFTRSVNFDADFESAGTRVGPFDIDGLGRVPKAFGETETATIVNANWCKEVESCFIAMRAKDSYNSGAVSNVVTVKFPVVPPSSTDGSGGTGENLTTIENDRNYSRGGLSSLQLALAIVLPLFFLLIIIIAVVLFLYCGRRKRRGSEESSPPPPRRTRPIISTPLQRNGTDSKSPNDVNKKDYAISVVSGNSISPVNSYSAAYLLTKYDEEVKKKTPPDEISTPTAPHKSDISAASSERDSSMDTAKEPQVWWSSGLGGNQEIGLPKTSTARPDVLRPGTNAGNGGRTGAPPVLWRKHTLV